MIRAAAVFGCAVALSAEPKLAAVPSAHENKLESHVVQVHDKSHEANHAETKKATVVQTPKKSTPAKKAAVPPHHDHAEVKKPAAKTKIEKKHSAPVALSRKAVAINKPLEPKLSPESDEKFMKGDYPYDTRPKVTEKFDGVYPKMQTNKKYNSDYVKDDNNDGGHWAAQTKYDALKNKLAVQRKKTQDALAKEQKEREEHKDAKGEHKEADQKAVEAEKEAIEAEKEAGEAEKDLEKAEEADKKEKDKEPQNLAAAEEKVQKAQLNLKGCEKKLEDARRDLDALKKEKGASGEKAVATEQTAEQKAAAKERAEAAKAAAAADAEREKANSEEAEHEHAKKEYEAEKKEEQKTESDLDKAEAELRRLRGETAPEKKTVAEEKSATTSLSPMLVVAGVACLVALK